MSEGLPARSWNDPPQLSFSQIGGSGARKNLLNKRVPFPLNESVQTEQSNPCQGEEKSCDKDSSPKLLAKTLFPCPSGEDENVTTLEGDKKKSLLDQQSDINLSDSEILAYVIGTFESSLKRNSEKCESYLTEMQKLL